MVAGLCFAIFGLLTTKAFAANQAPSPVAHAQALTDQAHFAAAIALLEPLVQAKACILDDTHRGIAWNILGTAHQNLGQYEVAQHCYESAIRLLKDRPSAQEAYVAALDNLGSLEGLMGQMDAATSLRMKSRRLYRSRSDNAGLARTDTNLAIVALSQSRMRRAREYLADALLESQQTTNFGDGDRAAMYVVQGNIAAHDRDYASAVQAYTLSIDLWKDAQGRESLVVAWEHALRGDAYRKLGNFQQATTDLQTALVMAKDSDGGTAPVFFQIELLDAKLLRASGNQATAEQMESEAKASLEKLQRHECNGCSVSADAFR